MRRGARESQATAPDRIEGWETSATSGAKARTRAPRRRMPRRPASARRLSKTKTSSTPGIARATASPRGDTTSPTSLPGQRAFRARTAGPRKTVSPRNAGWTRRKRTGSGERPRLLDEHDRDPVPDRVGEAAARAVDLALVLVELQIPLALRAGQDLLQLGRERHRHLRGTSYPAPPVCRNGDGSAAIRPAASAGSARGTPPRPCPSPPR